MIAKFTQPDYTDGDQSGSTYPLAIDASIAVLARHGRWFAAHQQDQGSPSPELSVRVDAGFIWDGLTLSEIAAQTVSGFTTPSAGQHRIDRVVIDAITGVASRVAGTAVTGSPSATAPTIPAGKLPCCQVLITSSDTVIVNSMITDERVFGSQRPRGIGAVGRNFQCSIAIATASTAQFTADEVELKDSAGTTMVVSSVSVDPDLAASGANGLDTGAEAPSTWYYEYVIAKPDGTVAGLWSTSPTSPTLPSGYTFKALVSAAYNNGSSNLVSAYQRGNWVFYRAGQLILSGGSASTETALTITSVVPPIGLAFKAYTYGNATASGSGNALSEVFLRTVSTYDQGQISFAMVASAQSGFGAEHEFPSVSGQTFYYLFTPTTNVAAISINVKVKAFQLPCCGE